MMLELVLVWAGSVRKYCWMIWEDGWCVCFLDGAFHSNGIWGIWVGEEL